MIDLTMIKTGHEETRYNRLPILLFGRSDKSLGRPPEGHGSRCPPEVVGQDRAPVVGGLGLVPVHIRRRGSHPAAHLPI
jgi:hypothetical protein